MASRTGEKSQGAVVAFERVTLFWGCDCDQPQNAVFANRPELLSENFSSGTRWFAGEWDAEPAFERARTVRC
jgi:hypothetical protein